PAEPPPRSRGCGLGGRPRDGAHGGARTDVMTPDAGRRGRLVGFDWLRGIALFLVVLRHVLEVTNLPVTRDVLVLDQGQLGVALFCAMAGFFALGGSQPVGRWALDRARRPFPAYWIATAARLAAYAG